MNVTSNGAHVDLDLVSWTLKPARKFGNQIKTLTPSYNDLGWLKNVVLCETALSPEKAKEWGNRVAPFNFTLHLRCFSDLGLTIYWLVWFLSPMHINIKLFKGCAVLTARAAHSPSTSAMLKWDLCPSSSSSSFFFFVFFVISGLLLIHVILPPYGANTFWTTEKM